MNSIKYKNIYNTHIISQVNKAKKINNRNRQHSSLGGITPWQKFKEVEKRVPFRR